jgi:hypothetical protein
MKEHRTSSDFKKLTNSVRHYCLVLENNCYSLLPHFFISPSLYPPIFYSSLSLYFPFSTTPIPVSVYAPSFYRAYCAVDKLVSQGLLTSTCSSKEIEPHAASSLCCSFPRWIAPQLLTLLALMITSIDSMPNMLTCWSRRGHTQRYHHTSYSNFTLIIAMNICNISTTRSLFKSPLWFFIYIYYLILLCRLKNHFDLNKCWFLPAHSDSSGEHLEACRICRKLPSS